MRLRRINRDTKHILYSNMSGELKSVLEDGPIEGEPLVSVCVITYNHGKYIRQCLDGILMQKVNFPYEILIHDDASPDDTADIIREYWEKYPTVIKPILQTENQYSQGRYVSWFNFDRAKAKYIAHCEGDDYWTDDGKLQMQVDFLEEHEEYIGTAHNVRVIDGREIEVPCAVNQYPIYGEHIFSLTDAEYMRLAGQTASLVYRNIYHILPADLMENYYACSGAGDRKLAVLLTLMGNIHCFSNVMSVYRYIDSHGSSWSARIKDRNIHGFMHKYYLDMMDFAEKSFSIHLYMEQWLLVCISGGVKKIIISREWNDFGILWQIISSFQTWKLILKVLFKNPMMFIRRCAKVRKLPKVSFVTYT